MPVNTRSVYGPQPTQAMVQHKRSLAAEPKWPQVIAPQKSLWDGFLDTMSGVGSSIKRAEDRWNRATTVPIPPKFVGGTPENQAARERFSQQAGNAASGLVDLPQKVQSLLPIGQPAAVAAKPIGSNPPAVAGASLPDPFAEAVAQSGISPTRPSAPASLTPVSLRRQAGADLALPLQRISPPPAVEAQKSPAAEELARAVTPDSSPSRPAPQTPDDLGALMGLPPASPPSPQSKPNLTDLFQTSMTLANPNLARVAPGAPTIPGRERPQDRVAGYTDMFNPQDAALNAVAPRAAWQPDMGDWLEGPLALQAGQARQQAAQRQAQEAQNQLAAETIQATARPGSFGQAFGTRGGTAPRQVFERRGSPSDFLDYMAQATASRDAAREGDVLGTAEAWPGAWQGWVNPNDRLPNPDGSMVAGPGRSTTAMLSPEQRQGMRLRRAARNEDQAIRQQMVTARAQGRRMSPEDAAIAYLMGEDRPLSEDQRARTFGPAYLMAEAQKAGPAAEIRKAELDAETELKKLDPKTMMMAGLGGALANLREGATPDLISSIIGGVMDMARQMGVQLPGQGNRQPTAPAGSAVPTTPVAPAAPSTPTAPVAPPTTPSVARAPAPASRPLSRDEELDAMVAAFDLPYGEDRKLKAAIRGGEYEAARDLLVGAGVSREQGESLLQRVTDDPTAMYEVPGGYGAMFGPSDFFNSLKTPHSRENMRRFLQGRYNEIPWYEMPTPGAMMQMLFGI